MRVPYDVFGLCFFVFFSLGYSSTPESLKPVLATTDLIMRVNGRTKQQQQQQQQQRTRVLPQVRTRTWYGLRYLT